MTETPPTSPTPPVTSPTPEPQPRRRQAAAPPRPRRSASWRPDPRWAHPVEFTGYVYTVSFMPWLGVPVSVVCALGFLCGVVGALRARAAFPREDYGDQLAGRMTGLSLVAGVAAAVWLYRAGHTNPLTAGGWLLAVTILLGLVYAVLRSSAPRWQQAVVAEEQARAEKQASDTWDRILTDVSLKLRVVDLQSTRAGFAVGVGPSTERAVPLSELKAKIPEITTRASMLLGREGITVRDGDISCEGTDASHVHLVHVRTNHVLEETIEFVPLGHPATAQDPIDIGLYEDGAPVEVALVGPSGGQHGFVVGATGSGKTTTVAAMVGRYAECVDVVQGVIATDKLVPFAWPWIRPYCAGRAARPGIDFAVGQNPTAVMEFLAGLLRLVRDRNTRLPDSGLFEISEAEPGIVVWAEETKDLIDRCGRIDVDGRAMTYSALIDAIERSGRSAQVAVEQLNQFGLVDAYGEHGSEIFRNSTLRIVLRTMTSYDGSAMLPGLVGAGADTTKLRHHSALIQPSIDEPRVMPWKGYLFGDGAIGDLVADVAAHRPELGAHEAAVVGAPWVLRWDPARVPELAAKAAAEGLTWPGAPAGGGDGMDQDRPTGQEDDVDRELRNMVEMGGGGQHSPDLDEAAGEGLPSADGAVADIERITAGAGRPALPEPLDTVMRLLEEDGAPSDFVSTRQLAIVLGRVPGDANEKTLDGAANELGRELSRVDGELRTRQRRQSDGSRPNGYDVALLRKVAARIAREAR